MRQNYYQAYDHVNKECPVSIMGEWPTDLTLHCATEENHHRECADQEWSKKTKWEGYQFRKKNAVHC